MAIKTTVEHPIVPLTLLPPSASVCSRAWSRTATGRRCPQRTDACVSGRRTPTSPQTPSPPSAPTRGPCSWTARRASPASFSGRPMQLRQTQSTTRCVDRSNRRKDPPPERPSVDTSNRNVAGYPGYLSVVQPGDRHLGDERASAMGRFGTRYP